MRKIVLSVLIFSLVLAVSISADESDRSPFGHSASHRTWADLRHQDGPFFQSPDEMEGIPGGHFQKRMERLERLKMRKMVEVLELTDAQREKLVPFMQEMRIERDRLFDQRGLLMEKLRTEVHADQFNEEVAADLLKQLGSLEEQQHALRIRMTDGAAEILSVEQTARLMLFMEHFEANLFRKARGEGHGEGRGMGRKRGMPEPPPPSNDEEDNN